MYAKAIDIKLPKPWKEKHFITKKLGFINFLVGPNGSGKSRFCEALKPHLPGCRILNADRIASLSTKPQDGNSHLIMSQSGIMQGYDKNHFSNYKRAAVYLGSGADAFVILEEKLDIRIRVEATLSQLFKREMRLEWDSGRLVPNAYNITQKETYHLNKDECHGIKELIVLLSHLYDDDYQSLIIDEPELNLHPQYQAFLVQELRKIAGDPSIPGKKLIFLVTHSPFILDILTAKDLSSVICFHADFESPSHLFYKSDEEIQTFSGIIPRLNVHHKQFFFADCPVFVEGIFDAQFIKSLQEFRGVSMEGSGSCIIDVGGNSEIALYHKLIQAYNKKAKYIYDLDSIFTRALGDNAEIDEKVSEFLASIGAGTGFQKFVGELQKLLTDAIEKITTCQVNTSEITELRTYLTKLSAVKEDKDNLKKGRIAILIHLAKHRQSLIEVLSLIKVQAIEGKLNAIVEALKSQDVYLLKGGALEHYLPTYEGNIYEVNDSIKRKTVEKEIEVLFSTVELNELDERYGYLYEVIKKLPAGQKVDFLSPIKGHLSGLVYKIQKGIQSKLITSIDAIPGYVGNEWKAYGRILEIQELNITSNDKFICKLKIFDRWGLGEFEVIINETTNSGMGSFELTKLDSNVVHESA